MGETSGETMKITARGVTYNCRVDGKEGAPWVTLSHALANNLTLWDDFVDTIKDRYRVFRYDHRGHGGSDAPEGPYDFPMLVADSLAILDAAGIGKTHWIGLSIGGMIGYGLAIDHGDRLRSLIACDSRPNAPEDYADYFQHRIDVARDEGMEALADLTIARWFTPETVAANPPVLDRVRKMIVTTNPVGHAGLCAALKQLAYGPELHRIKTPTLILGGEKDKGAPPDILEREAKGLIPGAEQVVIPDAGHIVALENPEAFHKAAGDFLDRH